MTKYKKSQTMNIIHYFYSKLAVSDFFTMYLYFFIRLEILEKIEYVSNLHVK